MRRCGAYCTRVSGAIDGGTCCLISTTVSAPFSAGEEVASSRAFRRSIGSSTLHCNTVLSEAVFEHCPSRFGHVLHPVRFVAAQPSGEIQLQRRCPPARAAPQRFSALVRSPARLPRADDTPAHPKTSKLVTLRQHKYTFCSFSLPDQATGGTFHLCIRGTNSKQERPRTS